MLGLLGYKDVWETAWEGGPGQTHPSRYPDSGHGAVVRTYFLEGHWRCQESHKRLQRDPILSITSVAWNTLSATRQTQEWSLCHSLAE